jgi:anti-sigma B factor antagonist
LKRQNQSVRFDNALKGLDMNTVPDQAKSPVVCYIEGNLDSDTVAAFRALVARLRPGHDVIFDLRQVPFVDSVGLWAMLGAVRRVRENGGDAVISQPRPPVRRALHYTAIDRSVPVYAELNQAKDDFSPVADAA